MSQWRKSSFSGPDSNCVEMAFGAGVRDSKNPDAGHLALRVEAYQALVSFATGWRLTRSADGS